ncbi:MAG: insulinase family protein [Myxococcales bacterium]|nr:MAG: insulinase family protein [Myxococcales bacterium]
MKTFLIHIALLAALLIACSSTAPRRSNHATKSLATTDYKTNKAKEAPPKSDAPDELKFPAIERQKLDNGLELNVVEMHDLPMVHLQLVIREGEAADPKDKPGVASLTASMLEEGTRRLSSSALAETIEFLGAELHVGSNADQLYVGISALSKDLEKVLSLLGEIISQPGFRANEFTKLKKREHARLELSRNDPYFLASREFYKALYGDHPYAHIDTNEQALETISREDLIRWHREHVLPNNAFLVAVGDLDQESFSKLASSSFKNWKKRDLPKMATFDPKRRQNRQVFVVDRPESVQSVIYWGNLSIERSNQDYIPLLVANQVLGGSAAARLFMDLREKRSLTYGAYSRFDERAGLAPFKVSAAVRTEVTGQAMDAFAEHLHRITTEPVPDDELQNAERLLSDSFPLQLETYGSIADLVSELRLFGLPDHYWDSYRGKIRDVSVEQAQQAAQHYITPDRGVIVVVGKAADIAQDLRRFGKVTVLDSSGKEIASFAAAGK